MTTATRTSTKVGRIRSSNPLGSLSLALHACCAWPGGWPQSRLDLVASPHPGIAVHHTSSSTSLYPICRSKLTPIERDGGFSRTEQDGR
jgi:hypothetical protein